MKKTEQKNDFGALSEQSTPQPWVIITSGVQMDWKQTEIMYTLRAVSYKDPPAVMLHGQ